MIYYKIQNETGSYIDIDKNRFDVFGGDEVFFPDNFNDFCEADILSDALTKLNLSIYQNNNNHFDKLRLKDELEKIEISTNVNAWQYIKTMLSSDQYEDMLLAPYLSLDNTDFNNIVLHFKSLNLFDVDQVLTKCVI